MRLHLSAHCTRLGRPLFSYEALLLTERTAAGGGLLGESRSWAGVPTHVSATLSSGAAAQIAGQHVSPPFPSPSLAAGSCHDLEHEGGITLIVARN